MPISDKTRKLLWGRSGNRCAICKKEIVITSTAHDDESVVAEECHIISSRPNGPRHDPSYPVEKIDSYDNLILLCRTHHKMVDDQAATFIPDLLRQMKVNHEAWVSHKLEDQQEPSPVRLRRVKENIPSSLFRLTAGKDVLDVISNAMAYSFDYDELKSQEEVELIGSFLQTAQDWGDLSDTFEAGERIQIAFELTESLQAIEAAGFFVFGGREVQLIEGGVSAGASDWPIAILRVLRSDNQSIMHINLDNSDDGNSQPAKADDSL